MGAAVTGWAAVAAAVARRPRLWPEAVRQVWRLVRPGGRQWVRFRMVTAYGVPDAVPDPADVVAWLRWSGQCVRPGRSAPN